MPGVAGRRRERDPLVVVVVILDRHVGDVVRGVAGGDLVDLLRHRVRHLPRARWRSCPTNHTPWCTCSTASPTLKTSLSVFTARCTVVDSIGANLRLVLVGHFGRLELLLVDARGLRDLRQEHRLGGLIGAGHRRQHARALVLERDLLEVGRQRRRRERPRPGEVGRREPAAGDDVVDRAGLAHPEHVALGVAHPQQAGAGHGRIARLAGRAAGARPACC